DTDNHRQYDTMQERTQNAVRKDKRSPQKRQQEDRAHSTAIHCASKMQFGEHQDSPTPIFSLTGTFDGPPRRQKEIGSFLLTRPSINGRRKSLIAFLYCAISSAQVASSFFGD